MPDARGLTASMDSAADAAEAALARPEGVVLHFPLSTYHTLDACAAAARGFQQVFSSLRNRVRRMAAPPDGMFPTRDQTVRGRYDYLGCQRLPLPNGEGWQIILARREKLSADLLIIDRATGERINLAGDEREGLIDRAMAWTYKGEGTFTLADYNRLLALDPNANRTPQGEIWLREPEE